MSKKEFEKVLQEVKKYMGQYNQPQKQKKGWIIGLGIAVIGILIGLVLWIRMKNEEDIEEYYEYFDDEIEEELEDDELYGLEEEINEELEEELEEEIEYVNIKNFNEVEEETIK